MNKFCEQVQKDYPEFVVKVGKKFMFRPPRTIVVEQKNDGDRDAELVAEQNLYNLCVLHELGHARLRHRNYGTDVERLKMERAAWEEARRLAERYGVVYDEEYVEGELDTYREWLHRRSRCTKCGLTRYQTEDGKYHCPQCDYVI